MESIAAKIKKILEKAASTDSAGESAVLMEAAGALTVLDARAE